MNFLSILLLNLVFVSGNTHQIKGDDIRNTDVESRFIEVWSQVPIGTTICPDGSRVYSYEIVSTIYDTFTGNSVMVTHQTQIIGTCEGSQGFIVGDIIIEADDDVDPQYIMDEDTFRTRAIEYYKSLVAKQG